MSDFAFYFHMGWEHIISPDALDHLMFIAALAAVYLLRDWKKVLVLITAFTFGHALTLLLSVKEWVSVPGRLVEWLIPLTIMLTAASNIVSAHTNKRAFAARTNYFLAFFFGLIHGLAFANLLRMLLAADQNFATAMVSFSLGLEVGQVLVVLVILLLGSLYAGLLKLPRRWWITGISAIVFMLALEMFINRWPF